MTHVVTSTGLAENEMKNLQNILQMWCPQIKYSCDLTSEVEMLIIETLDKEKRWLKSKKFMYVVSYRPDVKVIDYRDVCRLENNPNTTIFSVPQIRPFDTLTISLCRLEDGLAEKTQEVIEKNGGKVIHHLTNETDVMISMVAEGRRYEAALDWGISVVSPDWCYDSVDRGLPMNTFYYKLLSNVTGVMKKLNYENEDDKVGSETMVQTYHLGRRDQACDWNKLKDWRDREQERKLEEYIRTKMYDTKSNSSFDDATLLNADHGLESSHLKRKVAQITDGPDQDSVVKLKRVNKTDGLWNSVLQKPTGEKPALAPKRPDTRRMVSRGPILQGLKFKLLGYSTEDERKLNKVIAKFGGETITTEDFPVDFTVVNFKYNLPVTAHNPITEFAIERFIYNERVDSGDYLWCKPFAVDTDMEVDKFRTALFTHSRDLQQSQNKIRVSITGFQGTDLSHIERLLKEKLSKWIEFQPVFSNQCETLIVGLSSLPGLSSKSNTSRKLNWARRWNVHVLLVHDFFNLVVRLCSNTANSEPCKREREEDKK